jgi:hypothetical protein
MDVSDCILCYSDSLKYYSNIYPTRCNVTQFLDKINCVTLHLVGYILEYYYDAWTHER